MTNNGRGHDFDNCSTGSECWDGSKLVISGVKGFFGKKRHNNTIWPPTLNPFPGNEGE